MTGLKKWGLIAGLALLFPALIILLLPLALLYPFVWLARGVILRIAWCRSYGREGKRVIFVYSNSPNWQAHVEQELLPKLGPTVVTLNWSERRHWRSFRQRPLSAWIFLHWRPYREFNPIAIVLLRFGRVRRVRFYEAYRALKHGQPALLESAEAELLRLIEQTSKRR
jgi:hypothetical protein